LLNYRLIHSPDALCFVTAGGSMAAEKLRNQTEQKDMWDLSPLFNDDTAWENLFASIKNRISEYDAFRGTLGDSAARLRAALDIDMELSRALDRLYTYAHLKNDEDKTNSVYTALLDRATMLYTRIA
jgi:oligoendopeptidase F